MSRILSKLGVRNRAEAAAHAVRLPSPRSPSDWLLCATRYPTAVALSTIGDMSGAQPPQSIRFCRAPGRRADRLRRARLRVRRCSSRPAGSASCSTTGRARSGSTSCATSAGSRPIIRYDERGHGLSDWEVDDHSLEARIGDLEAVADDAGFDRFALMAMSQGGPPAIEYAVRHPERLTRLIFYGSSAALMHDPTPQEQELFDVFDQMVRVGYGREDSVFRRVFTSLMIPGATEEQMRWLDDLQRVATSAENAYAARLGRALADTRHLLADLDLPTLVLHSRGDQVIDLQEGPVPRGHHPRGAAGDAGEQQPHRARRRGRLARLRPRGRGLPGRRTAHDRGVADRVGRGAVARASARSCRWPPPAWATTRSRPPCT